MGVPKFYRWLSERYPCLSEVINDSQIPEFDNLYLDMNGIIHNCSHPNDDDVSFRITEDQIFQDIFTYIEKLFFIVKPRKVFYMAIDGVAPRAKMNQQRARRFMSARTASEKLDKAVKRGDEIAEGTMFDSNCITPGTPFMTRLHHELCSWVERKINTDSKWQNIRIYLSGHNCPGEGEHKIMDFIRAERIVEGYDPNTRHCMYGLDADLIMLGLCSHEPHFSLLREEVKFNSRPMHNKHKGKQEPQTDKKRVKPTEITFHLLHLSLLREYLAWEFNDLRDSLSFQYDMERIVDDWVLMGFLVGNDFIPHLPHVHIHDDGLPLLYDTYKKVLPTLGGYINEFGTLNLKRFEVFLKAVADNDRNHFIQIMEDESFMKAKRANGKKGGPVAPPGMFDALLELEEKEEELVPFEDSDMSECSDDSENDDDETSGEAAFVSSDEEKDEAEDTQKSSSSDSESNQLASASDALANMHLEDPIEEEFSEQLALSEFMPRSEKEFENNVEACWSRSIGNSFKRHKRQYYREKLQYANISKEQLKAQSEGYVRAIQWILHYYYHGCVSWNWYFEHHYAPYISDVVDFADMEITFDLSKPFQPFEQLLAVLPAASSECLPVPLRELMCSSESPIADFYPTDFKTDLNGKKNDWEAVVLIPFIDEKRLLEAIQSKTAELTPEENARNAPGPHVLFTTDTSAPAAKAKITHVDKDKFRLPVEQVVWGLLPNVKMDVFFPGFPTMKHLAHVGELKQINVSVFNQPSRKASMVLKILKREELEKDVSAVAMDLIGKEVCVEWPVLKMGVVDSIIGEKQKFVAREDGGLDVLSLSEEEQAANIKKMRELKDRQIHRFAIDVSDAKVIVQVKRFLGVTYEARDGVLMPTKQYGGLESLMSVPLDLVVSNIIVDEGKRLNEIPVDLAFPSKSKVFVMDASWAGFGFPALVDKVENSGTPNCRVLVMAAVGKQPDLTAIRENPAKYSLPWYSGYEAGRKAGVRGKLFGRITGTVFLINGEKEKEETGRGYDVKINIGLSLKFTKRNLEVPDYTRKSTDNYWQYSSMTINLLRDYKEKFPELFQFLERTESTDDVYYTSDIWEDEEQREKRYEELSDYLRSVPTAGIEKQSCGMDSADVLLLSHIEKAVRDMPRQSNFLKSSVNPARIYRAELFDGKVRPDPEADFQLLDRVVYTLSGASIQLGMQGTVIGVTNDKLDIMFDKEFSTGYRRSNLASCAQVPISSVINITFGKQRKGKPQSSQPGPSNQPQRMGAGAEQRTPTLLKHQATGKHHRNGEADFKNKKGNAPVKAIPSTSGQKYEKNNVKTPKNEPKIKLAKREIVSEDPAIQKQMVQNQLSALLGIGKSDNSTTEKDKSPSESTTEEVVQSSPQVTETPADVPKPQSPKPTIDSVHHAQQSGVRTFTNSSMNGNGSPTKPFPSRPFPAHLVYAQGNSRFRQSPAHLTNGNGGPALMATSNTGRVNLTDMKPRTVALPRQSYNRGGHRQGAPSHSGPRGNAVSSSSASSDSVRNVSGGNASRRGRKNRLAMNLPVEE